MEAKAVISLEHIARHRRAYVEAVLRRRGVSEADLPDARQEVLLVVHRKLAEFEGRASIDTWLYRIASNVASEHRRRQRRRGRELSADLEPEPVYDADPHEALRRGEVRHALATAIAELEADRRQVIVLHELHGLPMREVAERLGCPLKTAFSRLYAARRDLRRSLEDRHVAPAVLLPWTVLAGWGKRAPVRTPSSAPLLWAVAGALLLGLGPATPATLPPPVEAASEEGTAPRLVRAEVLPRERAPLPSPRPAVRPSWGTAVPHTATSPDPAVLEEPATMEPHMRVTWAGLLGPPMEDGATQRPSLTRWAPTGMDIAAAIEAGL
jgi:RNA polymerase sigma-70 factor, ECF subfamily